ncbi:MAG: glycoside hydrolase family 13 protein [Bacteroidota bacterium]
MTKMAYFYRCSFLLGCFLFAGWPASAQFADPPRVDPPNWWVGMQHNELELLVTYTGIADYTPEIDYPGLELRGVTRWESDNYVGLQVRISPEAQPGKLELKFSGKRGKIAVPFALEARTRDPRTIAGVDASDLIYLIMPDRFANGDPSNDIVAGTAEMSINRDSMFWRHGGDLQGVLDHLDYLEQLGVTALWLNPVQENDEPKESYHGYAITDHYRVDPRLGDNELYKKLVAECHQRGIKTVMDVVYNHLGDGHYLYREGLPSRNWVHQHDGFVKTTYRAPTLLDPHVAQADREQFSKGWFDHHMPDLAQENPHVARYLIQNTIWWVEYAGLDGFRIDTYAYADQDFMSDLVAAVRKEYPNLGIFGETWVHGNAVQSWFTDNRVDEGNPSPLPGVTDFQLYYSINEALTKEMGWTEGISRMYYTLAKDYLYKTPLANCIFLDNHDLSRFYSVVGEDFAKFKMGIAWLLTMRGIPQIYYGTEVLMKNFAAPDGRVREDFPGGWQGDPTNKFKASGRTERENEAFAYLQTLAGYRKANPVLHTGHLTQFIPEKGLYVYFRHNAEKTVMVMMNCKPDAHTVEMERFEELTRSFLRGKDVAGGNSIDLKGSQEIPGWTTWVLELQ